MSFTQQWVLFGLLLIQTQIYAAVAPTIPTTPKATLETHETGLWLIAATPQQNRWVIIHNKDEAKTTGIYHIEVIGRDKKAPVWAIKHLANHIAITKTALQSSIVKPLKLGGVYPESFNTAYDAWKKENNGKGGFICTTSVVTCLK
jgi:Domain of unknown function (DUF5086)